MGFHSGFKGLMLLITFRNERVNDDLLCGDVTNIRTQKFVACHKKANAEMGRGNDGKEWSP